MVLGKTATYILLGAVVVIVGTFAAWQVTKIFSPNSLINSSDPELRLKTSDHDASNNPLPNDMTDKTVPDYEDNGQVILLPIIGGVVQLPRIQGEVTYR